MPRITEVKIADLLSFGPEQCLSGFSRFNLFIGKNGSGKSNALRLMCDPPIQFTAASGKVPIRHLPDGVTRLTPIYTCELLLESWNRHFRYGVQAPSETHLRGDLSISYLRPVALGQAPKIENVVFRNGRLVAGDAVWLRRSFINYVTPASTEEKFAKQFAKRFVRDHEVSDLGLVNFGLYYVFDRPIFFSNIGSVGEMKRFAPGDTDRLRGVYGLDHNYESLPSGVFSCAKLLSGIVGNSGSVKQKDTILVVDEPEASLEPRACRKFFQFLVWLSCLRVETQDLNREASCLRDTVESQWQEWKRAHWEQYYFRWNGKNKEPYDEPSGIGREQVFIASHSSTLIDEHVSLGDAAAIFEFDIELTDNSHDRATHRKEFGVELDHEEIAFSTVRRVDSRCFSILDNLGCRGADLLQANGVIWVEGPSDVVYIRKWIDMHCAEHGIPPLRQGRHYEFQMFAGTLLDSLCLVKDGITEDEAFKKLVEMFSFSRNAYVVIDSDAVERDGIVVDRSKFVAAKRFIKSQFEQMANQSLNLWFEEGNVNARTLEDYLDSETIKEHGKQSESGKTKKLYAQAVTSDWDGRPLAQFPNNLEEQIQKLVAAIQAWNR